MADGHLSEAACLIEQGATYRRRVGLQYLEGDKEPIFAGFKPGAFAVYFGDAPFYHFDLEGRWQRAFVDGTHFLKGLDGTVQSIDRVRDGASLVLKRGTLSLAAASDFDSQVRSMALSLIADLDAGELGRIEPKSSRAIPLAPDELRDFLQQITGWTGAAWLAGRESYVATYSRMPFLPPECVNAVVLQATLGHAADFGSGQACTTEPYQRSAAEFRGHVQEVAALWGRRLLQSRTIFLAGSEVLRRPEKDVMTYLATIREVFSIESEDNRRAGEVTSADAEPTPRFDGVHCFLDDFGTGLPPPSGWARYAAAGLSRVTLGVVSGDPRVRSLYHQRWSDDDLRGALDDVKSAGIGVSVLTLVGAGGIEHSESHLPRTGSLIASLDLRPGDFVFLLDEKELCDPTDTSAVRSRLHPAQWEQQQSRLKEALAGLKERKVKVLPYTLEKQGV